MLNAEFTLKNFQQCFGIIALIDYYRRRNWMRMRRRSFDRNTSFVGRLAVVAVEKMKYWIRFNDEFLFQVLPGNKPSIVDWRHQNLLCWSHRIAEIDSIGCYSSLGFELLTILHKII